MHRHGYKGRELHRDKDQRRALLRGLATSLVEHGKIQTTLPKAKELVPYIEKLITKAKRGDLHSRRQVIANLTTVSASHRLVDVIAPQLGARVSGHVRLTKTVQRVGDNAQLATVEFVDTITDVAAPAGTPREAAAAVTTEEN